ALAIGSLDEDGRAIMGGLLGEPLELVRCETSDVLVPAHAEMVLEGEILPGTRIPEGPFGEFTGYSLGERPREVVRVRAITHRRDAIFQDITVAHLDHLLLSTVPIEANLYRAVRAMVPTVTAVRVPGPYTCFVSIEARGRLHGEVGRGRDRQAIPRGLHAPPSRAPRRLAADQPQRLPRLASGGPELRPPSRGRRPARPRQGRAPLG